MTGKGRAYEHDLGDIVATATDGDLVPLATGYNSAYSRAVDLIIDDGEAVHAFELKTTSSDAYTLYWDEDDQSTDDLYGLYQFCVEYPRPTYPYAGIRFDNRQLALARGYVNDFPDRDDALATLVQLSPIEASATSAGNLRFYKPDTDDWPAKHLDDNDAEHVLERIGYSL